MSACKQCLSSNYSVAEFTTISACNSPGVHKLVRTACRSKVGADAKWATIAVVTEKHTKKSAKGNTYGIWRLSDLQGTNVSLFLTGKAQADLSKETEGSVVAVFKPEVIGWIFYTLDACPCT